MGVRRIQQFGEGNIPLLKRWAGIAVFEWSLDADPAKQA
jgi:hypothetical protein